MTLRWDPLPSDPSRSNYRRRMTFAAKLARVQQLRKQPSMGDVPHARHDAWRFSLRHQN